MKGVILLKKKTVIVSLISLFLLVIILISFRLILISEDFSALSGAKAIATLWRGEDIAELTSDNSETVLMSKNNDVGKNAIVSALDERGYKFVEQMGSALICEKNSKKTPIIFEMYSGHYRVYFLPNE